jgi:hypothetical protein
MNCPAARLRQRARTARVFVTPRCRILTRFVRARYLLGDPSDAGSLHSAFTRFPRLDPGLKCFASQI